MIVYQNGAQVYKSSYQFVSSLPSSSNSFTFGNSEIDLDNLRIYERVLSASEVEALYEQ